MKSLKDHLREEFKNLLEETEFKEEIEVKKLDIKLINNSFERLLENISGEDDSALINDARAKFETFIINYFKK